MPDPIETPPAEPVIPPEPPIAPVPLADADGNLKDGWLESLDEKYREEPYLKEVKNVQSMASSVISARRMVGKDKIAIPNEGTTDEEWNTWHKAGGRPETAADYNIVRPETFPEEHWKAELALAAQDLFHKIGLSTKQAAALMEFNNANVLTAVKAQADAIVANRQIIKDGLFKDLGAAYDQKIHQGNYAIDKGTGGDEEFKTRLTEKFGDDPDFIRYNINIGGKFAEHGDISAAVIATPGDIQAQIDVETAKKSYRADYAKHGITKAEHKRQVDLVAKLFQEKTKATKTG